MFYRLLGKFFLFFFVIPSVNRTAVFVLKHASKSIAEMTHDIIMEDQKQRQRCRRDHPAGTRRPR